MLKVAICDDIPLVTTIIEQYIHEYHLGSYQIDIYNSSESLIKVIKTKQKYTLFFLDIEIDGCSGVDIARHIREYDTNAFIIFITSFKEYMSEVFQVHTFDYLLKPVEKQRIFQILEKVSQLTNYNKKQFVYSKNYVEHYTPFGEILFFEKRKRQTLIHTKNEQDSFYMTTNQILEQLDDQFTQIHTSYIININAVSEISKNKVLVKSETGAFIDLPISRKYRESAYNKIIDSFKKML